MKIEGSLKFLLILVSCLSLYKAFHFIFLLPSPFSLTFSISFSPSTFQFFVLCYTWRCQWRIRAPTRFSPWLSMLSTDADDLQDYRTVLYRLRLEYLLSGRRSKVLFTALQISPSRFVFRCLNLEFLQ